jgi:hypothetical protein
MVHFKVISDPMRSAGTSRIWFDAFDTKPYDPSFSARFRGSLLALFGEPFERSSDVENAFSYLFEVTNERGELLILTAYHGPSGPAFGGLNNDEAEIEAADALLALIEQTPPADFEVVLSAPAYESRSTYGCRAGECYWHEEAE